MFRRLAELLDVREATDEEVAAYEAEHNNPPPPREVEEDRQEEEKGAQQRGEEDDELSEVSLGSSDPQEEEEAAPPPPPVESVNDDDDDEFHAVSLSPDVVGMAAGDDVVIRYNDAPSPPPPVYFADVSPPVEMQPPPVTPPADKRKLDLASALAATPFRGDAAPPKSVSFSLPPTPAQPPPPPPPPFTSTAFKPVAAPLPLSIPATPSTTTTTVASSFSAALPSTVKLATHPHLHPPPSSSCLLLDAALAERLVGEDAHLSGELDDALLAWATSCPPVRLPATSSSPPPPPPPDFTSPLPPSATRPTDQQQDKLLLLQAANERIAALELAADEAERAHSARMEHAAEKQREEHAARVTELERKLAELETQLELAHTQELVVAFATSSSSSLGDKPQTAGDAMLKHCSRLARSLGGEMDEIDEKIVQAEQQGRVVARLAAQLVLAEQQIVDEKLVLKNLFISWMERAERQDAFEILASAFGFTAEDRDRLGVKPSWKRANALGVRLPFSESVADFVRDETS